MTYSIIVDIKPTYLHAKGYGEQTEANTRRFAIDAYLACVKHNMSRLLFEMCFTGKALSVASMYSVALDRTQGGSPLSRIAYVDNHPAHVGQIAEFAETFSIKRGVNVRLFESVAAAEQWLGE